MKYFLYLRSIYSIENNLQNAVLEYLKDMNRLCIDGNNLDGLKYQIINCIEIISLSLPEHKPVKARWLKMFSSNNPKANDFSLELRQDCSNSTICTFYILEGHETGAIYHLPEGVPTGATGGIA